MLVLGAGASAPLGFPLGRDLVRLATTIYPQDASDLARAGAQLVDIQSFPRLLRQASPSSIDALLETRNSYIQFGRLLIAYHLIPFERPEWMFPEDDSRAWYDYLYALIGKGPVQDLFGARSLSVITFNYDRSFEWAIIQKTQAMHDLSYEQAKELLSRIPVVHIHGSLGALPGDGEKARPYSADRSSLSLQTAAQSIRIIHEGSDQSTLAKAYNLLRTASHVVFLGHGFHPVNIERLELQKHCMDRHSWRDGAELKNEGVPDRALFYGTAFGKTGSERGSLINPMFASLGGINLGEENSDVLSFIRDNTGLFLP